MCKCKLEKIHWTIYVAILIIVIAFFLWLFDECWCILDVFFEGKRSLAEVMTYAGAAAGGFILIGNLLANQKRAEEQQKTNELTIVFHKLTEKGHLDTRFKDAATLLASDNTTSILSGIHALVQIAIEANNKGYLTYVETIKRILCSALCEHNKKENESFTSAQRIVSNTIIDALFRKEETLNIFKQIQANFNFMDLRGVYFGSVDLSGSKFIGTHLENSYFLNTKLKDTTFESSHLERAEFEFLCRDEIDLKNYISNTNFSNAELEGASFKFTDFGKLKSMANDSNLSMNVQFSDDDFKKLKEDNLLNYDDFLWELKDTIIQHRTKKTYQKNASR